MTFKEQQNKALDAGISATDLMIAEEVESSLRPRVGGMGALEEPTDKDFEEICQKVKDIYLKNEEITILEAVNKVLDEMEEYAEKLLELEDEGF